MNESHCEREHEVFEALSSGRWDDALRRHADGCATCSDVILVQSYLGQMRTDDTAAYEPSSAGRVRWKAERRARQEALERVTRPITLIRHATLALATLGVAAAGLSNWATVKTWFQGLASLEAVAGRHADPLALGIVVIVGLATLGAWAVWAED